mmetsp:Transcript_27294/g.77022  ORF Transcript_27294/g.77022 Transcript_27294/m.77022 type:complete len:283 (+) Transcript_27294:4787-5635(+)
MHHVGDDSVDGKGGHRAGVVHLDVVPAASVHPRVGGHEDPLRGAWLWQAWGQLQAQPELPLLDAKSEAGRHAGAGAGLGDHRAHAIHGMGVEPHGEGEGLLERALGEVQRGGRLGGSAVNEEGIAVGEVEGCDFIRAQLPVVHTDVIHHTGHPAPRAVASKAGEDIAQWLQGSGGVGVQEGGVHIEASRGGAQVGPGTQEAELRGQQSGTQWAVLRLLHVQLEPHAAGHGLGVGHFLCRRHRVDGAGGGGVHAGGEAGHEVAVWSQLGRGVGAAQQSLGRNA